MKQRLAWRDSLVVYALGVVLVLLAVLLLVVFAEMTMAGQVDSSHRSHEAPAIQETPRAFHLPWTPDVPWHFTGGPHRSIGSPVRDALDFLPPEGADRTVRAAEAGTVTSGTNVISGDLWIDKLRHHLFDLCCN